jgi:rare lipoprotein A
LNMRHTSFLLALPFVLVWGACATSEKVAEPQIVEPLVEESDQPVDQNSSSSKTAELVDDSPESDESPKVLKTIKGRASWYGARHHGRKTASGEPFNKNSLTAAHRTLPFGTKVQVVNIKNGKSVVVKINDRGPFRRNLIIDLSHAAAGAIGMIRSGITSVELKVLAD